MSSPRSGSNHGSQPPSLSSSAFASSSAFHRYLIQPLSPKGWTSSSAGASERASQRLRRMGAPPGATPDKLQVTTDKTLCDTGAPVPVNAIDDYCPIDDDDDDGGSKKRKQEGCEGCNGCLERGVRERSLASWTACAPKHLKRRPGQVPGTAERPHRRHALPHDARRRGR